MSWLLAGPLLASLLLALLGVLVALGERRYRAIRREILAREDERAIVHPERPSPLEERVRALAPTGVGPERSGHRLLPDGPEALAARLALIDSATRTLDLQYYTWHDDLAGRVLAREVLLAAERGVRCRVLLDDLHASGTRELLETLATHPLVTVRVFNPSLTRRAYFVHWLFDFRRLNRRMHNKALVADGIVAITGGRNVGDVYFGLSATMNFRDCDVLAAGAAARGLADSVTRYWNSEFAFPSAAFGVDERGERPSVARRLDALDAAIAREAPAGERFGRWRGVRLGGSPARSSRRRRAAREGLARVGVKGSARVAAERERARSGRRPTLREVLGALDWCPSRLIDDPPSAPLTGATDVARRLAEALGGTRRTLEIEAGYLIPGREGVARFSALTGRGVAVRVLTNSFATNDVLAAQAGYAMYRTALLRAGVELHELKPDAPVRRAVSMLRRPLARGRPERRAVAGLHTKVLMADRRLSVIGSFNLDPRSAYDNSEVVLMIEGETFAARVAAFLAQGRSPALSYRVSLEGRGALWWDDDRARRREPGLTRPAIALAALVRVLPIERLL